ncbi:hypothetical protein BN996_01454 [Haloferax massiliensis]|uniref:Uncharacterized protein n=1 Tax=Haloferax massiliensis TaxID=1476858 RepID=A0A0D6JQT2_9EURY|nr:hypothetical protein BN996_01454 [Haloferax massiliensis]
MLMACITSLFHPNRRFNSVVLTQSVFSVIQSKQYNKTKVSFRENIWLYSSLICNS